LPEATVSNTNLSQQGQNNIEIYSIETGFDVRYILDE
jgi:hypothetical protein